MIGLFGDVMQGDISYIYEEYTNMVKREDKSYMSGRGWEYDAIVHYANSQKNDVILDIGGACSYFFIYLCRYVKESWCIDSIYSAERWAVPWIKSLKHYTEYTNGQARLVIQNAEKLPFRDDLFDTIITCSAMEHFENNDDISCAKEINRVLKIGGLFLGTVDFNWYREYMPEKYHEARFYTYQSLHDRIITPSRLRLLGKDSLYQKEPPDIITHPDEEYNIQSVFFALRKE